VAGVTAPPTCAPQPPDRSRKVEMPQYVLELPIAEETPAVAAKRRVDTYEWSPGGAAPECSIGRYRGQGTSEKPDCQTGWRTVRGGPMSNHAHQAPRLHSVDKVD
jgi:hypothetical protein